MKRRRRWALLSAGAGYEASMTNQPSRGDIPPDVRDSDGVGTTGRDLRAQREALGLELGDIAETLCIRLDFLKALEAGDYDALPGSAYAVGFVRSYARHLGMDSEKLAWQFKIELSGEAPTAKLDFLTPVQESRIPRGGIVLVTLLLAVTVYGVWYYMNARDLTFTELIPEVPAQFGAPAPVTSVPAEVTDAAPPAAVPTGKDMPASQGLNAGSADMNGGGGPVIDSVAGGAPPASGTAMDSQSPGDAASPDPAPPSNAPETTSPSPTAAAPPPAALAETPSSTDSSPPSSPEAAAPAAVPTRIEIHAKADSWVQVRTAGGTLLMTRIVAQGTSFVVPPEDGLTLTTGNAGGLEIRVDGVVVPTLGPYGAVRRDVALDPERLKAGTALAR